MKQLSRQLRMGVGLAVLAVVLVSCTGQPDSPADVVERASQAFTNGFNERDLTEFDSYFATPAQGGDVEGIANLIGPAHQILENAQATDTFEFRSFETQKQEIDSKTGTATVHYQAEISQLRDDVVIFAANIEGDIALTRYENSWLIAGGDQPSVDITLAEPGA